MLKKILLMAICLSSVASANTRYSFNNLYRQKAPPKYSRSLTNIPSVQSFIQKNKKFYINGHLAGRVQNPFSKTPSNPWYRLPFKYVTNVLERKEKRPATIEETWGFIIPSIGYRFHNKLDFELTGFYLFPSEVSNYVINPGKKRNKANIETKTKRAIILTPTSRAFFHYNSKIELYGKFGIAVPIVWISSKVGSDFSYLTYWFLGGGLMYKLKPKLSFEASINSLLPLTPHAYFNKGKNTSKTNIIGWIQLGLTYHFI